MYDQIDDTFEQFAAAHCDNGKLCEVYLVGTSGKCIVRGPDGFADLTAPDFATADKVAKSRVQQPPASQQR